MGLGDALGRTFVKPAWLPGPPKVERWFCPTCGRGVDRTSPAWKGIWFAAGPAEVTAMCARVHGHHDRLGRTSPREERPTGDDAVPIVAVDAGRHPDGPPASFIALLPPHGVAFVLAPDGRAYELRRPRRPLAPSDLVGALAAALAADVIGHVAVGDVRFEDDLGAVRVVAELGLAIGDPSPGDALEGGERPAAV